MAVVIDEESLWKTIPGYDGYQAHPDGKIRNAKTERIFQAETGKHEYIQVTIQPNNKTRYLHQLIALTFCENAMGLPIVDHIDGNKRNNKSDNLQWTSGSENVSRAFAKGGRKPSNNHSNPVRVIMKDGTVTDYASFVDAEKSLNVTAGTISYCLRKGGTYCGVQRLSEMGRQDRWLFKVERIITVQDEKIEENIPKTNDSCLSTDDIKWFGKNYNSSCGKLVFANAKSIGAKKSECRYSTLSEYKKSQPKEIQHEIHKTALDLVKRVQLHEQELWKQLAEISLSSASPSIVSNPLEENKILNEKDDFRTLSSFGFPPFFVPEKIPEKQHFAVKSDSAPAVVFDKDISVSTENSLSLLGDEWFDNLLRAELEISI